MSERFFVEGPIETASVRLTGAEAHHLAHVMRAEVGDEVVLFDGRGWEHQARVQQVRRGWVELEVVLSHPVDRELPLELTLAVCLPKGERQRWLVEKAVELGVAAIVPLVSARTIVRLAESARVRLERVVVEASKQCGRNRLLRIAQPCSIESYLRSSAGDSLRVIAHPSGIGSRRQDWAAGMQCAPAVSVAVGPEGGLTDDEIALAVDCGWKVVDLGPRVLRVETAAVALASLIALGQRGWECT